MGCSPSHNGIVQILAKNAARPLKRNKAVLPPGEDIDGITVPLAGGKRQSCHDPGDETGQETRSRDSDIEINHSERGFSDGASRSGSFSEDQRRQGAHGAADEGMVNLTYQKRRRARKYSSTCSEQELQRDGNPRRGKKSKSRKSDKHSRHAKQSQIGFTETENKVDFPELLVKAHQDAYAFLNPNLAKYEGIISMANQAAQTQLIMQQMASFMALRFDEINRCLEEIVDDGEKFLKNVGGNLTWSQGKDDLSEHPDLLQQLLQYTVNRMQSLNCTVSSVTTNALQETCHFLQSAVNGFEEKLKKKEQHNERLLKMIKALEDSAAGSTQPHPNDLTLYSEDSGFGGDGESVRGYRSPEKMQRRASFNTSGRVSLDRGEGIKSKEGLTCGSNMADSAVDIKGRSDGANEVSQTQVDNPRVFKQMSITSNISESSLGTCATLEQDSVHGQDPEESSSSDESCEESDDDQSLSSQITLPQRPLTSPAGTCAFKPKRIENPENEEMSLKMKEAISEKIKFVPGKSSSNVWTREEVSQEGLRPSTADGSNRRTSRHRRSRSAESLKSQGEDPTLLELQRTQKELTKKLDQLYLTNGARNKEASLNQSNKSFMHTGCIITSAAPTYKLKACLDKSFNILPSQELFAVRKINIDPAKDPNVNQDSSVVSTKLPKQNAKTMGNPSLAEKRLESIISPRQSVRKLIQAFSPDDDSIKNRKPLGPLRCVRKFGVPVLPPTIPACRGLQSLDNISDNMTTADGNPSNANTHQITSSCITPMESSTLQDYKKTNTNEYTIDDMEDFPPPPPEILMDDSFHLLQSEGPHYNTLPCAVKNTSTSSKIKTSINIKDLLPNKNNTETYMSTVKTAGKKEPITRLKKFSLQSGQHNREKDSKLDPLRKNVTEEVAHLYRQSHKIIPLQNPGDAETLKSIPHTESADQSAALCLPKQKQGSPMLQRGEKSPVTLRKSSPTRAASYSPPRDRKLASPPTSRAIIKTHSQVQPSPPLVQKSTSPSSSSRVPSPPNQSKLSSPPTLRKLQSPPQTRRQQSPPSHQRIPSPPQIRRQQSPLSHQGIPSPPQTQRQQSPPSHQRVPSPPQTRRQQSPPSHQRIPSPPQIQRQQSPPSQRRLQSPPQPRKQQSPPSQRRSSSPPSSRREPSPPSHFTPSPPLSPSYSHRGLRRSSDEPQASPKMIGNAQSIFCPSSTSLFEAKPASPPCSEITPNQASVSVLKHSLSGRHYDDQRRRLATSAANPQPFVRRCYSDRRPRVQLRLPTSVSATAVSEPALQQTGPDESTRKDSQSRSGPGSADPKTCSPKASPSELCVVGQGLQ